MNSVGQDERHPAGSGLFTAPSRMRFWFLPLSGNISEGDPFKDFHGTEETHAEAPPLDQTPLCLHHAQLHRNTS